ncbi:hypothetical protein QAD02_007531 [Eretmocerus hayati]|uniref:Uncharacterized protein n=1 Tax=Eretmocerus hayati TaxID=131215 RepID=A0ACC2N6B7_9HYME|nr:hypothetical protein QAD02_007531 [Eretmocerus hayati]
MSEEEATSNMIGLNDVQLLQYIESIIKSDSDDTIRKVNENTNIQTKAIAVSIENISRRLFTVEGDIANLDNRLTVLENSNDCEQAEITNSVINEVKERLYREKNVIIFGVSGADHPQQVYNLRSKIFVNASFNIDDVSYHRTGKSSNSRSRPIKLILDSIEHAKWVLHNQKQICPPYKDKPQREDGSKTLYSRSTNGQAGGIAISKEKGIGTSFNALLNGLDFGNSNDFYNLHDDVMDSERTTQPKSQRQQQNSVRGYKRNYTQQQSRMSTSRLSTA